MVIWNTTIRLLKQMTQIMIYKFKYQKDPFKPTWILQGFLINVHIKHSSCKYVTLKTRKLRINLNFS